MKTNSPFHLEDQLKFLRINLEQGAALFTTDEGRKAYYRSLLIEIRQITEMVKEGIILIKRNTTLFPTKALFKTPFAQFDDEIQSAWEKMQEKHELGKSFANLDKALQELHEQLQTAHACLNTPEAQKMIDMFLVLWNKFELKIWPAKAQELQAKVLAGLSHSSKTRHRQLNNQLKITLDKLNRHPITILKQIELGGEPMDEISHRGQLVAEALAPIIFNNRDELGTNKCIFEFFTLFMTYNALNEELNKIHFDQASESQQKLDNWFLAMADKLQHDVKPAYRPHFNTLIVDLCHHPDLNKVLKKSTLRDSFNLKLAYNLFGIMIGLNVFSICAIDTLRKRLTTSNHNVYFTYNKYIQFGSNTSELTEHLEQVATEIIGNWKAMAA